MSELAKSSRKAMQEKAKRLVSADPKQKVDSSTWTPPAELDTEAKTGARPLVRRIYKSGGKVEGMMAKKRADRAARKSGGRTAPWVDDLINRDVRTANEAREGKKHVGAFKKGGRTKHADGNRIPLPPVMPADIRAKRAAMAKAQARGAAMDANDPAMQAIRNAKAFAAQDAAAAAREAAFEAEQQEALRKRYEETGGVGYKKGGKISKMEWEHSKEDLKQDKKLAKKHGMSLEKWEKSALDEKHDKQQSAEGLCYGGKAKKADGGKIKWIQGAIKHPGSLHKALKVPAGEKIPAKKLEKAAHSDNPKLAKKANLAKTLRAMHASGGEVFSGNSTTKVPGVVGGRKARMFGGRNPETEANAAIRGMMMGGMKKGGRAAHAKGGKAKGKTHININVNTNPAGAGPMPMPPIGLKPPMPLPMAPPMAPPPGAPMGGAGADPALLAALAGGMKGPAPAPMGAGPAPMPRKSGGRTIHVINHAAGGGLGRLEKIKAYGEAQKKLS